MDADAPGEIAIAGVAEVHEGARSTWIAAEIATIEDMKLELQPREIDIAHPVRPAFRLLGIARASTMFLVA